MEQTEKLVELTEEDIKVMKSWRFPKILHFSAGFFCFAFYGWLAYFLITQLFQSSMTWAEILLLMFALVAFTLLFFVILGFLYTFFETNKSIKNDIEEAMKKIIICQIEDLYVRKNGRHQFYKVKASGEEYYLSKESYYQFTDGQMIEIHLTQPSGKLLRILPIKEESEIIAERN